MSHDRVAPSRVDTGRPVRVWVYDAKTSQERDVMYMAPEFSGQNGGPSYYRIPVVLLFCIAHVGQDENGRDQFVPTVLRTYGKLPYMYVRAPEAWQNTNGVPPSDEDLERVRHRLDDAIWEKIKQGRAGGQRKMEDDKNEDTVSGEKRGRKEVKRSKALGTGKASLKQANFSFAPTKRSHDRRENEEEEAEVAKPVRDQASEEARLEQQYNESCNEFACGIEERVAEARGDEELQRQVTLAINMEWEQLKLEYQCALENLAEEFGSMEPMVSSSNTVDPAPVDENDAQPFGWYDNSGQTTSSGRRREPYVHSVEFVHKPTTHHFDEAKSYLRVTLTSPNLVTSLRSLLWTPVAVGSTPTNVIHQENKRPPSISFKDGQGKVHALPQDDLAECKVEFYMRYLIDQKLDMCAWLEVNNAEHMDEELVEGNTSTAFLAARHNDIRVLDEKSVKMPPPQFLEVGMDIETRNTVIWGDEEYNDDQGHKRSRKYVRGAKFPNAQTPDNSVQCICLSIHPHGEAMTASAAERRKCVSEGLNWDDRDGDRKTILKRQRDAEMGGGWYEVFYWGDVNEQKVTNARSEKPIKFHQARDELCMLRMFRDCLAALRAEIPLTWNGNAFDVPYIYDRLKTHYGNKSSDVFNVADMVGATSDWQAKREEWRAEHARFQSAQAGKRGGRDIIWSGMPWRDVMQEVIRNYKFRSYKLDWVAEHFLGEHKDDMDPALITPKWDSGPDGAAEVVSYCCWDAELPWRISQVNRLTENLLQMACVTMVPPQALLTRGQSIKSYIQVLKIAAERGFLVHHHEAPPNAFDSKRGEAKYKVREFAT